VRHPREIGQSPTTAAELLVEHERIYSGQARSNHPRNDATSGWRASLPTWKQAEQLWFSSVMSEETNPTVFDQGEPGGSADSGPHDGEPHIGSMASRLNWLRAGVLGANDGIVSTAGLVVGVAGATSSRGAIFTAGLAGLVAGAVSMALGEYISVSSQRDSEKSQLAKERRELELLPKQELAELAAIYESKGLSPATAQRVAEELTTHDALAAHAEAELHIDPDDLTNPYHASAASALAFFLGAMLPLVAILLPPEVWRVPVTVTAVLTALALAGMISARIGGSNARLAVTRVVIGGAAGLALTYTIGRLFGTAIS